MSHDQVLHTGVLFKKGSGNGPFGRKNWKPRYFVLTPAYLRYYTFQDGDLRGEVDISQCDQSVLEVMPADSMKTGSSASTIWRVAINAPGRRLLVAAGTEMEMNEWVDKLLIAFQINSGKPLAASVLSSNSSVPTSAIDDSQCPPIRDFQNFTVSSARRTSVSRSTVDSRSGGQRRTSDTQLAREVYDQEIAMQEQQRRQSVPAIHQLQSHEAMLELQRQKKREQHERERSEREEALRVQDEHSHNDVLVSAFDEPASSDSTAPAVFDEPVKRETQDAEYLRRSTEHPPLSSSSSTASSTVYMAPPSTLPVKLEDPVRDSASSSSSASIGMEAQAAFNNAPLSSGSDHAPVVNDQPPLSIDSDQTPELIDPSPLSNESDCTPVTIYRPPLSAGPNDMSGSIDQPPLSNESDYASEVVEQPPLSTDSDYVPPWKVHSSHENKVEEVDL